MGFRRIQQSHHWLIAMFVYNLSRNQFGEEVSIYGTKKMIFLRDSWLTCLTEHAKKHMTRFASSNQCFTWTFFPSLMFGQKVSRQQKRVLKILHSFFPSDMRSERAFDHLVDEMVQYELALRTTVANAELLVFTSTELPLQCWRFEGKYYLWGVFRQKQHQEPHSQTCSMEPRYNSKMREGSIGDTASSEGKIPLTIKSFSTRTRSPLSSLSNCSSYGSHTS